MSRINGWEELEDYKLQTVDRIDPNGNYEPSNCRFLSLSEQQQNKRKKIEHPRGCFFIALFCVKGCKF